ncbi:HXXEE domain-containing protein [Psychrobacter sp. I-STPA10]|uniref:HXXEE domain-containing protein n=1 Tax=Psychrobacter sp. I-STPA10 TaxID=2585769 RepID=UPI001E49D291|nr:HXXEE domain-containing protein [Psychrobacter sp. I-STPA10]
MNIINDKVLNNNNLILNKLIFCLPFAFIIHNTEEAMTMEAWLQSNSFLSNYHMVTTKQFSIAVFLFSVLGLLVVFLKRYYKDEKTYYFVIAAFCGILLLNVFFPHLLATIIFKKYASGVVSAVLINLPLTLTILFLLKKTNKLTQRQIIIAIAMGGVSGIILAFNFLKIGHYFEATL